MVATVIAAHDGNITNFSISVPAEDFAEMVFDVEVWNVGHPGAYFERTRIETLNSQGTACVGLATSQGKSTDEHRTGFAGIQTVWRNARRSFCPDFRTAKPCILAKGQGVYAFRPN